MTQTLQEIQALSSRADSHGFADKHLEDGLGGKAQFSDKNLEEPSFQGWTTTGFAVQVASLLIQCHCR